MNKAIASLGCALSFGAFMLGSAQAQAQAACPSQEVVFLFDQSNSMNWDGSDGNPKSEKVRALFESHWATVNSDAVVAVMGFGNAPSGAEIRTEPYTTPYITLAQNLTKGSSSAAILAAVDSAATPSVSYNTPLAGGTCVAVNDIRTSNTSCTQTTKRIVYLYTDGQENSTPTSNSCYSADSSGAEHPFNANLPTADYGLVPHTWEWNMVMKARCNNIVAGCNALPMPDALRPVMNVSVLFDWVNRLSTPGNGLDGAPIGSNLQSLDASAIALFQGLTQISGGTYFEAKKVNGVDAVIPLPGDTDPAADCTCVNDADLERVLSAWDLPVEEGHGLSVYDLSQRDVNNDGKVDVDDYYIVAENYGLCTGTATYCHF
jgi:hypothetical protein